MSNFHPLKPIENLNDLLVKVADIMILPVTKSNLIHTEAVLKLEQFYYKYQSQLGNLDKILKDLINKWKTVVKEKDSTRALPNPVTDALRRKCSSFTSMLTKLYEEIGKETFIKKESKLLLLN